MPSRNSAEQDSQRAPVFRVEMAMALAMTATARGIEICQNLSCFLSECQPLMTFKQEESKREEVGRGTGRKPSQQGQS